MFNAKNRSLRKRFLLIFTITISFIFVGGLSEGTSLILDSNEMCWILDRINIIDAWEITTGDPDIVVAVIDSGIDFSHSDLIDNQWINKDEKPDNGKDDDNNGYIDDRFGWDFYYDDNEPGPEGMELYHGHGTFVAGIIAASMNGYGVVGVSPNVKVMNLRALDKFLGHSSYNLSKAVNYAVDNGADVINFCIDGADAVAELNASIEYAYDNNVIMVGSVGGFGWTNRRIWPREFIEFPAAYDEVICVSATDYYDGYANYSNWGYGIDVSAPGGELADPMIYYPNSTWHPVGYSQLYGISHVPQVAGVVALMKSLNRSITLEQAKEFLTTTAVDIGDPGYDEYFGHGMINATAAVLEAAKIAETSFIFVSLVAPLLIGLIVFKRRQLKKYK